MCIVDGWVKGDRSGRSHVLVAVLIDHVLQTSWWVIGLIENYSVVDGSRGSLEGDVRVEKEVEAIWLSDVLLDDGARNWVAFLVAVTLLRECSNVVSLGGNHSSQLATPLALRKLVKNTSDMGDFLIDDLGELALRDTITHIIHLAWCAATTNLRHPIGDKRPKDRFHGVLGDHLDSNTVCLASSSIPTAEAIVGHCKCGH